MKANLIKTPILSKHLLQMCLFSRNTDLRLAMDTCYPCNHRSLFSPREQSEAQHCSEGFSSLPSPITFKVVLGLFSPILPSSPKKPLYQICTQLASKAPQKHIHTTWVRSRAGLDDPSGFFQLRVFCESVKLCLCMFLIAVWNTSCKKGNRTCKSLHLT